MLLGGAESGLSRVCCRTPEQFMVFSRKRRRNYEAENIGGFYEEMKRSGILKLDPNVKLCKFQTFQRCLCCFSALSHTLHKKMKLGVSLFLLVS